jgi:hypothetical protein
MPTIGPKRTVEELRESAKVTREGSENRPPLPGVKADAREADPAAFETNRKLAERIQQLVKDLKESDDGTPRFLLAWRMYPNAASRHWDKHEHSCGCCCGCAP